jgi:crossover junction endodeoxyribonuclease RusA
MVRSRSLDAHFTGVWVAQQAKRESFKAGVSPSSLEADYPKSIRLPWPPSANNLYRVGAHGKPYLTEAQRSFRAGVPVALPKDGRLKVTLELCSPDRRTSDIDNRAKAVLDGLQHAGHYLNDSQIDTLIIQRGPITPGGCVIVTIESGEP